MTTPTLNSVVMQGVPQRGVTIRPLVRLVTQVYWRLNFTKEERDTVAELKARLERPKKNRFRPGKTRRFLLCMLRDPVWRRCWERVGV